MQKLYKKQNWIKMKIPYCNFVTFFFSCHIVVPSLTVEYLTLPVHIPEVPCLNLGPETGYSKFPAIFSDTPSKSWNSVLN